MWRQVSNLPKKPAGWKPAATFWYSFYREMYALGGTSPTDDAIRSLRVDRRAAAAVNGPVPPSPRGSVETPAFLWPAYPVPYGHPGTRSAPVLLSRAELAADPGRVFHCFRAIVPFLRKHN